MSQILKASKHWIFTNMDAENNLQDGNINGIY